MKQYSSYQDSRVSWIGDIPTHWKLNKVSRCFDIQLGKMLQPNPSSKEDEYVEYLCAVNVGGNILKLDNLKKMWISPAEKSQYGVKDGDLLVVEGGDVASCAVAYNLPSNIYIQNALHRVRSKKGNDVRFLRYFLLAAKNSGKIDQICNKATIAHFTKEKFGNLEFVEPPKDEQEAIANFIDSKIAELDLERTSLLQQVDLLKELKQAIVTNAVTRGLHNEVELKDSGKEWIGNVPKHWNPIPMKYYYYMKGRIGWQGLKADEFKDEGPYLVTGTDFENGKVVWERCYHITEERYAEDPAIHVRENDLLVTKDGTVGKLAYIDEKPDKVSLNSHLLILRPYKSDLIYNKFTYWYMMSRAFKTYIGLSQTGSIMESLSQEKIGDFWLALPSLEEQREISDFLDKKTAEIDEQIDLQEQQIQLIEELKQSIISQAVTGKIKVI